MSWDRSLKKHSWSNRVSSKAPIHSSRDRIFRIAMARSSNNLPLVVNFPPCIHYNAFLAEWFPIKSSNPVSHRRNNARIAVHLRSRVR
jgi:hypothetical protein